MGSLNCATMTATKSNTERDRETKYCCPTERNDSSLASPNYHAHFLTLPVQRLQLYRSTVKPTKDQNAAGFRESGVNTDSRVSDWSTAEVLLRALWPASFFIQRKVQYSTATPWLHQFLLWHYSAIFFNTCCVCNVNMYYVNNIFVAIILCMSPIFFWTSYLLGLDSK